MRYLPLEVCRQALVLGKGLALHCPAQGHDALGILGRHLPHRNGHAPCCSCKQGREKEGKKCRVDGKKELEEEKFLLFGGWVPKLHSTRGPPDFNEAHKEVPPRARKSRTYAARLFCDAQAGCGHVPCRFRCREIENFVDSVVSWAWCLRNLGDPHAAVRLCIKQDHSSNLQVYIAPRCKSNELHGAKCKAPLPASCRPAPAFSSFVAGAQQSFGFFGVKPRPAREG